MAVNFMDENLRQGLYLYQQHWKFGFVYELYYDQNEQLISYIRKFLSFIEVLNLIVNNIWTEVVFVLHYMLIHHRMPVLGHIDEGSNYHLLDMKI